jgi:hypothetical protein
MLEKFVSVTRATLKGTVLIGLAQGMLGGLAFWAAGIDGAIFWGTVMTVLSIIPGIGGALVWIPAVLILMTTGEVWRGIALGAFCGLVVGSVDNLLRPLLVGRDTQMHELLIFFSTLGGLMMFGVMGFIVGPILAALFVTAWDLFATAFRASLAEPARPMGARRGRLVRVGLRLSGDPPHLLERLHVFQRRLQCLGGGLHRFHQRLACRLTGYTPLFAIDAGSLGNFPHALPLLTRQLERLALAVASLTRVLCQLPEPLGLVAC